MVKVLTGRVLNANYGFKVPPSGFDTTAGNGNMVYVKLEKITLHCKVQQQSIGKDDIIQHRKEG
ncbi:Protein of unknown function [Gryllus bimaculatus]|nr:Protein of unknown function [Gryllus bimaculatus]